MNEQVKPKIVARWDPAGELRQVEGTESKLIEGTLDCLRRLGLKGTTSRAIVAAAGVNLGAITYHFGSKDELVARALLQAIRGWIEPVLAVLRQDIDPAVRLMAAIEQLRATFGEARDMLPVYLEALLAATRNDTLQRGVHELLTEVRSFLTAQLTEERDTDYIPAWVEPDAMASLLMATADGLALHALLEGNAVDLDRVGGQAIMLLAAARQAGSGG